MKRIIVKFLVLFSILMVLPIVAFTQENKSDGIYLILDASGSMWGQLPDKKSKIEVAKEVLNDFVKGDFQDKELAFRVYGHRKKADCTDSELLIPFGSPENVITGIKDSLSGIKPLGKTPITYSLKQALIDFGDRSGEIILISDGVETCDIDPCELVKEWKDKDVEIKVHVVGLGLDEKSKKAMKCIADASGTEYQDASSASELKSGLTKIKEKATAPALIIKGKDSSGNSIRIEGTLSGDGEEQIEVSSNRRYYKVEPGEYTLMAGVRTKNGNLYKPVTKSIKVAESGETGVEVEVEVPPSVKAKFTDEGEEQRGSLIHAYQDGKEVFKFRWMDEVYLDEGTYEFRAKPNLENDLSVTESFGPGDHKEIVFEMIHTVLVKVKMVASDSDIVFRQNYELWQDGEKKYLVHFHNGARILPGKYDLRLPHKLFIYDVKDIEVTDEDEQQFDFTVPVGHVTFIY
ncbi:hypothetical protein MYX76_11565 [Desulfobacterota bacterium AH_259_B03_O07]|nr:hypothetical protein [Desulfobacterota bacterium AH_259_B03_O07]